MIKPAVKLIFVFMTIPCMIFAETGMEKENAQEKVLTEAEKQTVIVNPYFREEPRVNLNFSVPVQYISGIDLGAYYDLRADLNLNRFANFFTYFRLGPNIPSLDAFSFGWDMAPFSIFRIGLKYQLEYFPQYRILEQNASIVTSIIAKNVSKPHWFDFEFTLAANFRFIDLDLKNNSSIYNRDWLFEWFFLYRFYFLFHPASWLSTGFSFGNYNEVVTYSSNYFQVEFNMIFKLPKRVSIQLKGGFAFSAFLMNPGYINKGWGELGVRYEIPFK